MITAIGEIFKGDAVVLAHPSTPLSHTTFTPYPPLRVYSPRLTLQRLLAPTPTGLGMKSSTCMWSARTY